MPQLKVILFIVLSTSHTLSWAELSKWVDAQGHVHYGDSVPQGAEAQAIDSSSMSTVDSQVANQGMYELNKTFDAQRDLQQRDSQRLAEKQQQKQQQITRCENLKQDLRVMQLQASIYTKNADGTRNYVSDEQRKRDIFDAQTTLKKYCS